MFCASDEGAFFEIYLQIRRQPEPQVVVPEENEKSEPFSNRK